MGFWGSLVLLRTEHDIPHINAITSRDEGVDELPRPGGSWRLARCEGSALYNGSSEFLRELTQETQSPAISAYVFDSDCIDLMGTGKSSGTWRACLGITQMSAYLGQPLDGIFLDAEAASDRATRWSAESGLVANQESLRALFQLATGGRVEQIFFEVLNALGISNAKPALDVVPVSPSQRPARRTRRPTNRLDAFVCDFATDVLRDAGFNKKGRTFVLQSSKGDLAGVKFRSYTDFLLEVAVLHRPIQDEIIARDGDADFDPAEQWTCSWQRQWGPQEWGGAWRIPADPSGYAQAGERVRNLLRKEVIPKLLNLLDRAAFIDIMRGYGGIYWLARGGPVFDLRMLADERPTFALIEAFDRMVAIDPNSPTIERAKADLLRQGVSDDAWQEAARGVYQVVEQFLANHISPAMAEIGFDYDDLGYHRTNDLGDRVCLQLKISATASDAAPVFYVDAGFLPVVERDWIEHRRRQGRVLSSRRFGAEALWYYTTVAAPPECAVDDGVLPRLGIVPWTYDPVDAKTAGTKLCESLVAQALSLTPALDREALRNKIVTPGNDSQDVIVMLVDEGPSEQLEACLQHAEGRKLFPAEREFAAWARERLARRENCG